MTWPPPVLWLVRTRLSYVQVYAKRPLQRDSRWIGRRVHVFEPRTVRSLGFDRLLAIDVPQAIQIQPVAAPWAWQRLDPQDTALFAGASYVQRFCADVLPLLGIDRAPIGTRLYWGFVHTVRKDQPYVTSEA